jgi:hypothetical protein
MTILEMHITDALYALDEPWRDRFLVFTARLANQGRWDCRVPDRDEVEMWLKTQLHTQKTIAEMLWAWTGRYPGRGEKR